jgi:hydrogenase nickel incorporation protein HypA/HybF
MHELSIALSIVDGALDELKRHGASKATALHLRLGRLAGVDKDALLFSYKLACEETPLAASQLIIEDVDVRVFCATCNKEQPVLSFPLLQCATCGGVPDRIVQGQELEIVGMEIAGMEITETEIV